MTEAESVAEVDLYDSSSWVTEAGSAAGVDLYTFLLAVRGPDGAVQGAAQAVVTASELWLQHHRDPQGHYQHGGGEGAAHQAH